MPNPQDPYKRVSLLKNRRSRRNPHAYYSTYLNREVKLDMYLPPFYATRAESYPVMYFQDGQDVAMMGLCGIMDELILDQAIAPFVVVGVHANEDRMAEYGVASTSDYRGRGSSAPLYTQFLLQELKPNLEKTFRLNSGPNHNAIAGFSLGGLTAFDLAWHHPETFGKVGVFSGSFWWRQRALDDGYENTRDRIMHNIVRETADHKGLRMWFETGTLDETSDRNGNGIIDAIDDTLDLIALIESKGYRQPHDIVYREVEGGRHDVPTWRDIMPEFLSWVMEHPQKLHGF
ncbi:MAG: alpha/beta hydrolase-fold protein [Bacteroidota bacterium]